MGLDMYLEAEFYVSNWDHSGAEEQKRFAGIIEAAGIELPQGVRRPNYGNVTVEAAYWRKVNAVHAWFVDNVQDGKDECQRSYVELDTLKTLVALCNDILGTVVWGETIKHEGEFPWEEPTVVSYSTEAVERLAPRSGFFFGSYDFDSRYFEGLKDTVAQLQPWIDAAESETDYQKAPGFYYQASW